MTKKLLLSVIVCLLVTVTAWAQETTVQGQVTDSQGGEGLPGVSVFVKGTTTGTVTDASGNYSLGVPAGGTLVFQSIGFVTQEIAVQGQTTINVQLVSEVTDLDEVVVVGYGEVERRNLTGSISKVGSDDLATLPTVSTFENALQGRTAGVQVIAQNGILGAPVSVRVRGTNSINASSQPLYVIDGIPVTTGDQGTGSGQIGLNFGGSGTNPLKNINPSEIASIEVLKDAAASSIYGSRGANGVVIITTKRGAPGKPKVSVNYYAGFTQPTNLLDVMDGQQFTDLWNVSIDNRSRLEPDLAAVLDGFRIDPSQIGNTNWLDLTTKKGFVQELNTSVSGGNERTTYFFSIGLADADGYVARNEQRRLNIRANIDQKITDKLTVSLSVAPSRSESFRVGEENAVGAPLTYSYLYFPNVDAFNEDGSVNLSNAPNTRNQFPGTPISNQIGTDFESVLTQIIANTALQWQILPSLTARTQIAIDYLQIFETRKFGEQTTDGFGVGSGDGTFDSFFNWTWTNTLNYNKTFGDHNVSALIGSEIQRSQNDFSTVSGNTFPDDRLKTLQSAATIDAGSTFGSNFSFAGFFSRLGYTWKNRYILNFTFRADISSRFGDNNPWGYFPAVSAAWIASDEPFFEGLSNTISFLKLRTSYGLTGNASIGNFDSRGLVAFGRDYNQVPGFEVSSLANADLTWEETTQFDIALDWAILDNRISGSIGFYQKTTTGLLLDVPLPEETGTAVAADGQPNVPRNVGEIRNQGIEVEVSADIFTGDFKWTASANFATLDNEVLELPDLDGDGEGDDIIQGRNIIREGEPLGAWYMNEFAGVDPSNGDALYSVAENDVRTGETTNIFSNANRVIAGDPFPDFYGGFTNRFAYKGFDLSVFFQFVTGIDVYRNEGRFYETNLSSSFNQITDIANYWTPTNTDTNIPEPRFLLNNGAQHSTRYLDNGSYLRLKTLTFGYTLPKSVFPNLDVRFYFQGQNIWTITDYRGLDPEVSGTNNNVTNLSIFFNAPQAETYLFGVNVTF